MRWSASTLTSAAGGSGVGAGAGWAGMTQGADEVSQVRPEFLTALLQQLSMPPGRPPQPSPPQLPQDARQQSPKSFSTPSQVTAGGASAGTGPRPSATGSMPRELASAALRWMPGAVSSSGKLTTSPPSS